VSSPDWLDSTFSLARRLLRLEQVSEPEPAPRPAEVSARIDLALPPVGRPPAEVFELLGRLVELTPKTSSRRFYNQLFAGREPLAAAAEVLTGLLNSSMYTYKVGGVQVLVEQAVTRRLCQLAGFPEGEGTWTPGGSLANLTAMVLARNEAFPEVRDTGAPARPLTVYVSEDGHYSVRKNAGMMGIGRRQVRQVATDEQGRMLPDELDRALAQDLRDGYAPVCIVATAGTTVLGSFDPLRAIAAVARRHGVWLHVDGAYGGTFLLHPELRRRLDGVELADSLVWNAHKMMGVPLPASAVLVRRRGLLHRHFNETADYLFQQDDADLNLGTQSMQCGRRNDALKVWAAWQALGDQGWAARIEHQVALARYACDLVSARPRLELVHEPECLNVCFAVRGKSAVAICERLGREGSALIGYGAVRGRKVLRLVTVNADVERADLERLFADIDRVASELPDEETVEVAALR
jgi:glutamate/tyrosine decarboxylase-like PLP-dependent enzyme